MRDLTYLDAVVAVAFACSAALVFAMKYDMRVCRTVTHETYWRWPRFYRVSAVIRLTIKLYVMAYLLACLTPWLFGGGAKWATGPFQLHFVLPGVLAFALRDVLRCLHYPVWDLFVSYKSEDVEFVRAVVDQLISSGVKVWFAEYQILLQNYDRFQNAVDYGLRNCAYCIAFTDDGYFGSKDCQHELAVLLDRLPPEKVLQVKMPRGEPVSHSPFPRLDDCPSHEGEDVNRVHAFVKKHMKAFSLRPVPDMATDGGSPRLKHLVCLGMPFYLNADGWELDDEGKVDASGSICGLALKRHHPFMTVNLYCGGGLTEDVQRWRDRKDDREVYTALRSVADQYTHLLPAKVRGLHLFFHSGYSHLALTLLMSNLYWSRKYSVILPAWSPEDSGEFVFDFGLSGGFRGYCRAVPLMDQLVRSLRWRGAEVILEGAGRTRGDSA